MTTPSITITPIACGHVSPLRRDERERDERVQPEPRRDRERVVRDDAHRERHDPGDERRHREHLRERQPERLQVRDPTNPRIAGFTNRM